MIEKELHEKYEKELIKHNECTHEGTTIHLEDNMHVCYVCGKEFSK